LLHLILQGEDVVYVEDLLHDPEHGRRLTGRPAGFSPLKTLPP